MDKRVEIYAADGSQITEINHVVSVTMHESYVSITYKVKEETKVLETNMSYMYHTI